MEDRVARRVPLCVGRIPFFFPTHTAQIYNEDHNDDDDDDGPFITQKICVDRIVSRKEKMPRKVFPD